MSNLSNTKVLCFRSDYSHMSSTSSKYGLNVLQQGLHSPPGISPIYTCREGHPYDPSFNSKTHQGGGFSWRICTLIAGLDMPRLSLWKFSLEGLAVAL